MSRVAACGETGLEPGSQPRRNLGIQLFRRIFSSEVIRGRPVLFNHLVASRPPRERRWGAWLIAGALHGLLVFVIATLIDQPAPPNLEALHHAIIREDQPVATMLPLLEPLERPNRTVGAAATRELDKPISVPAAVSASSAGQEYIQPPAPASTSVAPTAPPVAAPLIGSRIRPLDPAAPDTRAETVRARIEARLQPAVDSIVDQRAAAARAKDWTAGGAGRRWGISPGKIHLGNKAVATVHATGGAPPPDLIVPPPGRREETNSRLRSWQEIQSQARRAEAQEIFEKRLQEIRARRQGRKIGPT